MIENMPIVSINATLLLQMINFAIIVWIFKKYLVKPMNKFIEERKEKIRLDLENAEKSKTDALAFKKDSEVQLKEARQKAQDTMNDAIRKAEEIKEEILKEAHTSREKMITAAEADIVKIKDQVKRELRGEMTEIAIKLAEKMIGEKMTNQIESNLVDSFIDKVGETK
jgi:F-type H+-transporting ATPase subunit b